MFVTNFTMASQSAWHPEFSDSGIYGSSDNFSQSHVYVETRSDAGEFWYRQFMSLRRRVAEGLEWDISRFEKHLRELKLELTFVTNVLDEWVQDVIQIIHINGSRSCERPTQPPPLPNTWPEKTSISSGMTPTMDSNPVNRQYSSFHPNTNSSELNFTANNGNDSVQSISINNIASVASEETYTCTCTRCVADSHTNNFRDSQTQTEPVTFILPVHNSSSEDACTQCDLLTVDCPPENEVVSPENEVNSVHEHRDTRDRVTSCERGRSMKRTSKSSHCRNISVSRSSSSGRSDSRDRRSRSKYRSSEHSGLHSCSREHGCREEQSEKHGHSSQSRTSSFSEADSFSSTCRGEFSHVTSGRRCFSCDSPEHFIRDCPDKKTRTCFKCGSSNHLIKFCPKYKQQKVRFKS